MGKRLTDKIEGWYRGPWVTPPHDPSSDLVFMGGHRPHWTAKIAQALVYFWLEQWKWIIGTAIAVVGLWIALTRN
jgi:hypothetical protein